MTTILITGCGGHYMGDILNCYRNCGVDVKLIGVASEPDHELCRYLDEYYKVPRCNEAGYYDLLLALCNEKNVDILIPSIDDELLPLKGMLGEFRTIGTIVSLSDCPGLQIATNKLLFLEFLKNNGIIHPKFAAFETPYDFVDAVVALDGNSKPVCVKALDKAGSRGFRIIDPNADLFRMMLEEKPTSRYISMSAFCNMYAESELRPRMMLQEYLPGAEYSVDLLADHGKILYMVGRMNHVVDNSIPLQSTLVKDDAAYEICRKVVELLELDGNIGLDFIYNEHGVAIPIEVNARITATIALCAAGQLNLAGLQVRRLLGLDLPPVEPVYGTSVIKRHTAYYTVPEGAVPNE